MEFILGPKPSECVLCGYADEAPSRESRVLVRSEHSFVVLNKYPYAAGHLLVVPKRHVSALTDLPQAEHDDLWRLVRDAMPPLQRSTNHDGVNLGVNFGKAAGAGIDDHLHVHLVPRWTGDRSFMAVIADVWVMPEYLDETWARFAPYFAASRAREET